MNRTQHGTSYGYAAGCRCDKCTAAKAANMWARRHVEEWDTPLSELVRCVEEGAQFIGKKIILPSRLIIEAIVRHEQQIKMEALSLLWHERKKEIEKL